MDVFSPLKINHAELVGVFQDGSEEWHRARSHGIGGSEIGGIMGLSPFSSAYRVWAVKTGRVTEEPVDNWAVKLGKAFEKPILDLWAEQNPDWEVLITGTYRHSLYPWALANLDGLARHRETGELMVLEVKTARNYWDQVPPHYLAQVQWYLWIMGIKRARIIAVAGWDYRDIEVAADEFEQEAMRAAGKRLWECVEGDGEPSWDGSQVTYETLRQLHPNIEDTETELGELGVGLVNAHTRYADALYEFNQYKSATLQAMGRAKFGIVSLDGIPARTVAVRKARAGGIPWLEVRS
jgi:putative phage-type endonuclease